MNNTTNKNLVLNKTAIANLNLSEAQMGMVIGGGGEVPTSVKTCPPTTSMEINLCQNNSRGICVPDEKHTS